MVNGPRKRVLVVLGALAVALSAGVAVGYAMDDGDDGSNVRADGSATSSPEDTTADSSPADATDGADGGTDGGETALEPPPTVSTDGLEGAALDLAVTINTASSLTYYAKYEGDYLNDKGATSRATVEIWRQLPLARRDTTIASADGRLLTRELRLQDQLLGCVDTQKGDTEPEWMCIPAAGQGVDPAEPVLGTVRPAGGVVAVREDVIGGIASRCYTVTDPAGTVQEACFDADGIPVSIDGGDGRLVRTEVSRGVDPDVVAIPEGATMRSGSEPA